MAHSCPDCDQLCHCGGDIDDIEMNDTDAVMKCSHWEQCQDDIADVNDFFDDIEYPDDPDDQTKDCPHCGWPNLYPYPDKCVDCNKDFRKIDNL